MERMQSFSSSVRTAPDPLRMSAFVGIKLLSRQQLESSDYPEYSKADRLPDGLKAPYYLVIDQGDEKGLTDTQPVVVRVSGPDNDAVVEVSTANGRLRFGVTQTGDIALVVG